MQVNRHPLGKELKQPSVKVARSCQLHSNIADQGYIIHGMLQQIGSKTTIWLSTEALLEIRRGFKLFLRLYYAGVMRDCVSHCFYAKP